MISRKGVRSLRNLCNRHWVSIRNRTSWEIKRSLLMIISLHLEFWYPIIRFRKYCENIINQNMINFTKDTYEEISNLVSQQTDLSSTSSWNSNSPSSRKSTASTSIQRFTKALKFWWNTPSDLNSSFKCYDIWSTSQVRKLNRWRSK